MTEPSLFVSVPRFARIVGLSERKCWKLVREGAVPVYRIGRRTLVKLSEGAAALERAATRGGTRSGAGPSPEPR
jgi:hypothetical protein